MIVVSFVLIHTGLPVSHSYRTPLESTFNAEHVARPLIYTVETDCVVS